MRTILVAIFILLSVSTLFILFNASATITISNISPADGAKHVDITNNPPDPGGYVTLSATLTDNTGNDDLEFWLDIWNGTAWVNRQHLVDQSSPVTIYQDETTFNHTNTTYQWRILALDHTDDSWNNQTFSFTTDKYPSSPINPSPANNSHVDAGNIPLYVTVYHPDNDYGAKIYNVSFYEYPSGRLIGWNHTNTGWTNGTVVKCNQTFLAKYHGTDYYWYVKAFDDEYNVSSDIFHFTTYYNDTEPTHVYYLLSSQITIETVDNEPSSVYYFLGSNISVAYTLIISNPSPSDNATVFWSPSKGYVTTSVLLNKSGNSLNYRIRFYTNKSGTWEQYKESYQDIPPNMTLSANLYNLKYNTTYWWKVEAYNDSDTQTQTFSFTTTTEPTYNDTEPTHVYYLLSSQITIETVDNEPSSVYYFLGSNMSIGEPSVSDPYPADGSTFGMQFLTNFSVYVTDPANQSMNVSFYYANNNTCWSTVNVQSGARAVTTKLPALTNGTTLQWYVKVNDSHGWNITSPTWSYTPLNHAPTAVIRPQDGDNFIEVRRKTLGSWKPYVRLEANVTDIEHDRVTVQIYVDDPTLPNWNDWVLRFSHIYDGYSTYSASKYIHDELDFNQTKTQYHWWLHLEDEYGATTDYYVNFTTKFMFYAYFTYSPAHPTNEDTVYFTDLSVNATTIAWKIDDTIVAQSTFSSGNHNQFNLTKQFNISNVYNITMLIYNSSANVSEIYYVNLPVDRNITINKTGTGAGYNYIAYHLSNTTDAKHFAQNFSLERGWWVFKYDTQNQSWLGYFLYPDVNNGTGDNFNVLTWDALVVKANKNEKVRVNISYPVNTSQSLQLLKGYNYVAWSNETTTTSKNLSIGLQTGDWVYVYDTISDTWYGYWVGYAGDDFVVNSYKTLIIYPTGTRNVVIG